MTQLLVDALIAVLKLTDRGLTVVPRSITLNAWATATGVSLDWLVNGNEAVRA